MSGEWSKSAHAIEMASKAVQGVWSVLVVKVAAGDRVLGGDDGEAAGED